MDEQGLCEIFESLGSTVKRVRGQLFVSCPLARFRHENGEDRHPSMSVTIAPSGTSAVFCHGCKWGSSFYWLICELNKLMGGQLEELRKQVRKAEKKDLASECYAAMRRYRPKKKVAEMKVRDKQQVRRIEEYGEAELTGLVDEAPDYMLERGVSLSVCKRWEIGYDKSWNRVVFPVRNRRRRLVAIMGRRLGDTTGYNDVYKPYWQWNKRKYLYGEHSLQVPCDTIIVVEGTIDVLRVATWFEGWVESEDERKRRWSQVGVVAVLGSAVTKEQAAKLKVWTKSVILMFDGDKAGDECVKRAVPLLKGRVVQSIARLPRGVDPGGASEEELLNALEGAEMVF